jgi:hypothetical protein
MSEESLSGLIAADRLDEAVQLSLEHRTTWVEQQLDYDTLERLEDQATAFFARWLPSLPPLERLQAAEWVGSHYVLSLVHLDSARQTGALFMLEAQAVATAALASTMRQIGMFADGPDAMLDLSVEQRLARYADQLDAMSFEFVPLDDADR